MSHDLTRQQLKEARDLDEQRKAGLAPLAKDVKTGTEISPHLPRMISETPWYYKNEEGPTLDHQRLAKDETSDSTKILDRQVATTQVLHQAKKFRPGACPNCGSMSHKLKECTQPRRKVGAKYTNEKIAPDEFVVDPTKDQVLDRKKAGTIDVLQRNPKPISFEEKRDPWAGVDDFQEVIEKNKDEGGEPQSKRKKLESVAVGAKKHEALGGDAARVLRDVDDVPKYLLNLDVDSAFYDAKSRSMRANPHLALATTVVSEEETKQIPSSASINPELQQDNAPSVIQSDFVGDNARIYGGKFKDYSEQTLFLYKKAQQLQQQQGGSEQQSDASMVERNVIQAGAQSMFLPTANELAFKAHRQQMLDEVKNVENAYGTKLLVEEKKGGWNKEQGEAVAGGDRSGMVKVNLLKKTTESDEENPAPD